MIFELYVEDDDVWIVADRRESADRDDPDASPEKRRRKKRPAPPKPDPAQIELMILTLPPHGLRVKALRALLASMTGAAPSSAQRGQHVTPPSADTSTLAPCTAGHREERR